MTGDSGAGVDAAVTVGVDGLAVFAATLADLASALAAFEADRAVLAAGFRRAGRAAFLVAGSVRFSGVVGADGERRRVVRGLAAGFGEVSVGAATFSDAAGVAATGALDFAGVLALAGELAVAGAAAEVGDADFRAALRTGAFRDAGAGAGASAVFSTG